jgi:hypothetical protein
MNFSNQTFRDETVNLDGNSFVGCTFVRCVFVYNGVGPVNLADNNIQSPRFVFSGAAASTIDFMSKLYAGGAAQIIEATFDNIRGGNTAPGHDVILGDKNPGAIH